MGIGIKRYIKIAFWVIAQVVIASVSLFVLFMLFAMIGMMIPCSGVEQQDEVKIFIRSNGVHTDVCVPVINEQYNWKTFIDTADYPMNSSFEYLAFGWGDEVFFVETETWNDLTVNNLLHALFWPSRCAMHVEYLDVVPEENENCKNVKISELHYSKLIQYIQNSFRLKDGKPTLISDVSYFGTDHFYAARGAYHLFENCNSWTNGALKVAGVRTASWALFPRTILTYQK